VPSKTFHFEPFKEYDPWVVFHAEGGLSRVLGALASILEDNPNHVFWLDLSVYHRPRTQADHRPPIDSAHA